MEEGWVEEEGALLDHERLDVYRVAREFLRQATEIVQQPMPRELREQFD